MFGRIVEKNRIKIIAEAGVNHNGSLTIAKKLIDVAADAGADYVKFQTFRAEKLVLQTAPKAEYQEEVTNKNESQFEMIKSLELDREAHKKLIYHCQQQKINFLSTPFDHDSIDLLQDLNIPFFKIPSGEITNVPYLRHIGRLQKPVIMSTGMATLAEIRIALGILIKSGLQKDDLTILHCNTEYPTPMQDVNLKAMLTVGHELSVKVGFSDHTLGIEIPIAAAALGATVIEKHFTLDRSLPGPDHAASLEPTELKSMVSAVRNIEIAMGNGLKKPAASEIKNIPIARKSIVAKRKINIGELFSEDNLTVKRPGVGICPSEWDEVIGKKSPIVLYPDDFIKV